MLYTSLMKNQIIRIFVICVVYPIILILQISLIYSTSTQAQGNATPTTVPITAQQEDWQTLFEPNEACSLPCLWGIMPGKSTLAEVGYTLLQNFEGVTIYSSNFTDNESLLNAEFNFDFENVSTPFLESQFHFTNRTLEHIFISAKADRFMGSIPIQTLNYFSAVNLLQVYGVPDSIRLYANESSTGIIADNLQFYWNNVGLYVHYQRCFNWCQDIEIIDNVSICFNVDNLIILTVGLDNPNSEQSIEDIISIERNEMSVEDVLGLTEEEFSQLVTKNDGCLPPDIQVMSIEWELIDVGE